MQWMRREVLTAWPGKAHFLLLAMAGRVSVDPRPYHYRQTECAYLKQQRLQPLKINH
jgi:hypothetical protein